MFEQSKFDKFVTYYDNVQPKNSIFDPIIYENRQILELKQTWFDDFFLSVFYLYLSADIPLYKS